MIWAIVSVLTFYLGALNTLLARVAGTCTQGEADRLWGVMISIPFYIVAVLGLFKTKYLKTTTIACSPVFLFALWQAAFAFRLALDILLYDASACEVLEGIPYPKSGDEIVFAILWPLVTFGTLIALMLVYILRRPKGGLLRG